MHARVERQGTEGSRADGDPVDRDVRPGVDDELKARPMYLVDRITRSTPLSRPPEPPRPAAGAPGGTSGGTPAR